VRQNRRRIEQINGREGAHSDFLINLSFELGVACWRFCFLRRWFGNDHLPGFKVEFVAVRKDVNFYIGEWLRNFRPILKSDFLKILCR